MFSHSHVVGVTRVHNVPLAIYIKDGHLDSFHLHAESPLELDDVFWGVIKNIDAHFYWVDVGLGEYLPLKKKGKTYHEGQYVLVQISRLPLQDEASSRGFKNARLSDSIYLCGRYCAFQSDLKGTKISHYLKNEQAVKLFKDREGSVLRQNLNDLENPEIALKEFEDLKEIYKSFHGHKKVGPAYKGLSPFLSLFRDLPQDGAIICETPDLGAELALQLKSLRPDLAKSIVLARTHERPLLKFMGLEEEWDSLFQSHLNIPGGVSIYIQETPVATVIDVNSGGEKTQDANLKAVKFIFEQIKWRGLSGPTVIDFINVVTPQQKQSLEQSIKKNRQNMGLDKIKLLGWSPLGFYEILSPRRRPSLSKALGQH